MIINVKNILALDLSHLYDYFIHFGERDSLKTNPYNYYRLLAYLSTFFNNSRILEIGSRSGSSGICLSHNSSNQVISYDIKDWGQTGILKENITWRMGDILTRQKMFGMLDYAFIFLDVDPHGGIVEDQVYRFLLDNNYQGFMVCDDVYNIEKFPAMNRWWKVVASKKIELPEFTVGIIDFQDQMTVVGVV